MLYLTVVVYKSLEGHLVEEKDILCNSQSTELGRMNGRHERGVGSPPHNVGLSCNWYSVVIDESILEGTKEPLHARQV